MGTGIGLNQPARGPGVGLGWTRLAEEVLRVLPREEIDAVWAFPNIRRDEREWGTAVIARIEVGHRRIYTARYQLVLKGKERGRFEAAVEEVGSGPLETIAELLEEVHKRTDDEHPPVSLDPVAWLPPPADGPAQ
jgi:hypothetical protein